MVGARAIKSHATSTTSEVARLALIAVVGIYMEIARVDLCGLEHGGPGWAKAREAVTASMEAHGFVVVAHDAVDPELWQAVFKRAMPEIFALPEETKKQQVHSSDPYKGYMSNLPDTNFESMGFYDSPAEADRVREFAELMWPDQGNPEVCDTIVSVSKNMLPMLEMVERMILEGLGVQEEHIEAHWDKLSYALRLSSYGIPPDTVNSMSMVAHTDHNFMTVMAQHEVEGLEVQAKDGTWLAVPPGQGTFTFVAGEMFQVLTNGRVPAGFHRVRSPSNRERLSLLFGYHGKDGVLLGPMDDLVDDHHPLLYRPCTNDDYVKFRYSAKGSKLPDPLKGFCGVDKE